MDKKYLICFFLSVIVITCIAIIRISANKPPDSKMMVAKKKLNEARQRKAPKYANDEYNEASMFYNSAMAEWKKQNSRFIIFRNYKYVSQLAEQSIVCSNQALKMSKKNLTKAEEDLSNRITKLGDKIIYFEERFGHFPMSGWHHDEAIKSNLLFSEGVLAFEKKNYNSCKTKLDSVDIIISVLIKYYDDILKKYFANYPDWKKMVDKTIQYSHKQKVYVVVIDKLSRQLLVYKNGTLLDDFNIELGYNWIGDKHQQGDKSTPEGLYKILEKKQNGQTKYHKALLLDYPNEDDKNRFAFNKKNGMIKPNVHIGNLIEIHGNGGKGVDWTDGCVALKDTEMDKLFAICPVGTKVTIVGSIKSLNELPISLK